MHGGDPMASKTKGRNDALAGEQGSGDHPQGNHADVRVIAGPPCETAANMNRFERLEGPALSQEQITSYQTSIKAAWQKAVISIVETGRLAQKIKDEVPYGEFGRLFEGPHKPFSYRTARMLMEVADHKIISDVKHASHLPASWYSLYLLTRIPDDDERLEVLIENKTVHAGLHRTEVEAILRSETSRNRRAQRVTLSEPFEPPYVEPGRSLSSDPPWVKVGDTLRQLSRLLIDIQTVQDEIRRSSSDMRRFRAIADAILSIVDGDPVEAEGELGPEDDEVPREGMPS
jgi:hypothetical protein